MGRLTTPKGPFPAHRQHRKARRDDGLRGNGDSLNLGDIEVFSCYSRKREKFP